MACRPQLWRRRWPWVHKEFQSGRSVCFVFDTIANNVCIFQELLIRIVQGEPTRHVGKALRVKYVQEVPPGTRHSLMLLGKDAERFSLWGKKKKKRGGFFKKRKDAHTLLEGLWGRTTLQYTLTILPGITRTNGRTLSTAFLVIVSHCVKPLISVLGDAASSATVRYFFCFGRHHD